MNFLTMRQELSDRLGAYDQTITADDNRLKRWLNMAQQYICGKRLWPFMIATEIVQTIPDAITGTVSVNAADDNLTFSVAPPTLSVNGYYIKFAFSNDWYKITAHTAGATEALMLPTYLGTSNLSAGTFTLRKLLYKTTTPMIQILDMKQLVTPVRLISQSPRETDVFLPLNYDAGTPYYYTMSLPDGNGVPQFSLLPSPDTAMNIMVRGLRTLTDLTSDVEGTIIPTPWHDAMIHIAAFYGFQGLDDSRAATEFEAGESRIADMANALSHDLGRHRVMQPCDQDSNFGLQWALPSDFGPGVP